jgi:hypothetical protein
MPRKQRLNVPPKVHGSAGRSHDEQKRQKTKPKRTHKVHRHADESILSQATENLDLVVIKRQVRTQAHAANQADSAFGKVAEKQS